MFFSFSTCVTPISRPDPVTPAQRWGGSGTSNADCVPDRSLLEPLLLLEEPNGGVGSGPAHIGCLAGLGGPWMDQFRSVHRPKPVSAIRTTETPAIAAGRLTEPMSGHCPAGTGARST